MRSISRFWGQKQCSSKKIRKTRKTQHVQNQLRNIELKYIIIKKKNIKKDFFYFIKPENCIGKSYLKIIHNLQVTEVPWPNIFFTPSGIEIYFFPYITHPSSDEKQRIFHILSISCLSELFLLPPSILASES